MATKRFSASKGKDGLLMITGPDNIARQATSYTRDGDVLRFSLAGDEGATYSVAAGDDDFEALSAVFSEAGVGDAPEPPPKPAHRSEAKTPAV